MHFWLKTAPSFEKKKQIVFKKITSILFLQISKQTSCENPIQIHQEMVYLCYFEDDNVLKWEKQVWSFYNRQSYLERATNKWFFFFFFLTFLELNLGFLLLVHESTHIKGAFEQEKWKWSKITNWAISWCKPSLKVTYNNSLSRFGEKRQSHIPNRVTVWRPKFITITITITIIV